MRSSPTKEPTPTTERGWASDHDPIRRTCRHCMHVPFDPRAGARSAGDGQRHGAESISALPDDYSAIDYWHGPLKRADEFIDPHGLADIVIHPCCQAQLAVA